MCQYSHCSGYFMVDMKWYGSADLFQILMIVYLEISFSDPKGLAIKSQEVLIMTEKWTSMLFWRDAPELSYCFIYGWWFYSYLLSISDKILIIVDVSFILVGSN